MIKKILLWVIIIMAGIFLLFISLGSEDKKPAVGEISEDDFDWDTALSNFVPEVVAEGWSEPVFLEVSKMGWFESQHVSNDGKTIYLFHYPANDFFTLRMNNGPFDDDADTYFTEWPFETAEKLNKYYLSEDLYSASGASTDADGNFFYSSNREGRADGTFPGEYDHQNIFRNDKVLAFNSKDENADNPFYCKAKDELWYDCAMDQLICVLKNATKNNFSGVPQLAPPPINFRTEKADYHAAGLADYVNAQAWLTSDCNTIYFTSNRGRPGEGPWIYRSERLDEAGEKWSEPEPVIKSLLAVGEPTMPADESKLFFVQFVMSEEIDPKTGLGEFRTAMYYLEKE